MMFIGIYSSMWLRDLSISWDRIKALHLSADLEKSIRLRGVGVGGGWGGGGGGWVVGWWGGVGVVGLGGGVWGGGGGGAGVLCGGG
jgi:hypothetical protein